MNSINSSQASSQLSSYNRCQADDDNNNYCYPTACDNQRRRFFEKCSSGLQHSLNGLDNRLCISDRTLSVFLQDPHRLLRGIHTSPCRLPRCVQHLFGRRQAFVVWHGQTSSWKSWIDGANNPTGASVHTVQFSCCHTHPPPPNPFHSVGGVFTYLPFSLLHSCSGIINTRFCIDIL